MKDKNNTQIPDYYLKGGSKVYKRIARLYDPIMKFLLFFIGGEKKNREKFIQKLDIQPSEKVIDVCCGTGTLTLMIADKTVSRGEVVGIDLSEEMLQVARSKENTYGVKFQRADAERIPCPSNYFDLAVICFALHEMGQSTRQGVLREMSRIIKDEGRIGILENNRPNNWLRFLQPFYMTRYERKTYKNMIEVGLENDIKEVGLKIIKHEILGWGLNQIIIARKQ